MTLKNTLKKGLNNLEKRNLNEMVNGWFIGDFEPSILKTKDFEVAIKRYSKGHVEKKHFHKISTEYTIIIEGKAMLNDLLVNRDEIIEVNPYEVVKFEAITDTITLVIKIPSSNSDKYIIE